MSWHAIRKGYEYRKYAEALEKREKRSGHIRLKSLYPEEASPGKESGICAIVQQYFGKRHTPSQNCSFSRKPKQNLRSPRDVGGHILKNYVFGQKGAREIDGEILSLIY